MRSPSNRPRTSASSIEAVPLNRPLSAISTSWQFCRLASTLPSTIELVAGGDLARQRDLAADDQPAQIGVDVALRLERGRDDRLGRAARRLGRAWRLGQRPGQFGRPRRNCRRNPRHGRDGGRLAGRPGRLHRDAQIVGIICHLTVLCVWSFAAEHGWDTPSTCCERELPGSGQKRGWVKANSSRLNAPTSKYWPAEDTDSGLEKPVLRQASGAAIPKG